MKILDFATADAKTAKKIVAAFTTRGQWELTIIFGAFWKSKDDLETSVSRLGGEVLPDGGVRIPFSDVTIDIWIQGQHILLSIDFTKRKNVLWSILSGLVDVVERIKRLDLPVKINKGDTITIKAAIAVAALAVAQGNPDGCSGILMDMARDKEI